MKIKFNNQNEASAMLHKCFPPHVLILNIYKVRQICSIYRVTSNNKIVRPLYIAMFRLIL